MSKRLRKSQFDRFLKEKCWKTLYIKNVRNVNLKKGLKIALFITCQAFSENSITSIGGHIFPESYSILYFIFVMKHSGFLDEVANVWHLFVGQNEVPTLKINSIKASNTLDEITNKVYEDILQEKSETVICKPKSDRGSVKVNLLIKYHFSI